MFQVWVLSRIFARVSFKKNCSGSRLSETEMLMTVCHSLEQGSLTGGPRPGSGPRNRPVRTRTYSQNRRLWFKTWRGASICNRRSFCSRYGSGLADEETHRPIECELSHPTWYYSANQVCAFKVVNIATLQCRQMREWEASYTWEDGRKKQTDSDTGRENKGRETEEWERESWETGVRRRKLRNVRNEWRSPKKEKWTAKIEHLIRNGHSFLFILPTGSTKPVCLICSETVALIKSTNFSSTNLLFNLLPQMVVLV